MIIYKGKIDITPEENLRLGGFAHRVGKSLGCKNKLNLRTLILELETEKIIIFTGDILFWDDRLVKKLKNNIDEKYNIKKESMIFSATHNHSGPLLGNDMLPEIGEYNNEYVEFLEKKVMDLLDIAFREPESVYIEMVKENMYFGVNRRYEENSEILMRPNYSGKIDNNCTVLKFLNKDTKNIEAILANYALHANVTDDNYINTDYPGVLCNSLEERYPNSVAMFLQGFTGNIRPKLIIGEEFFRGTFETVQNFSRQIERRLVKIIEKEGIKINADFESYATSVKLPMDISVQKINKRFNEENNEYFLRWLGFLKDKDKEEATHNDLLVQGIKLADNLIIITLNGEIVTEYSLHLREKYPELDFIIMGYSNGMIGYIATKDQLIEGGYEAEDFIYYFGLPGKYSVEIEGLIKNCMDLTIENLI